ncbi:MAG: glycosyltransferase family 2 protein [Pseudomonadota bacterium]
MRITLLIGPTEDGSSRFRTILKAHGQMLEKHGLIAPDWNHIRVYMACADEDLVTIVRFKRGFERRIAQDALFGEITQQLTEAAAKNPDHVILSTGHFGAMLCRDTELQRLKDLLSPHAADIRIVAHVREQSHILAGHYAQRVLEGRRHDLTPELKLAKSGDRWWDASLAAYQEQDPIFGLFNHVQAPPQWLDYAALVDFWEGTFGQGSVTLRPLDMDTLYGPRGADEINAILGTDISIPDTKDEKPEKQPPAPFVARTREFNDNLIRYMQATDLSVPRDLWRLLRAEFAVGGKPIDPGSLYPVSDFFKSDNAALIKRFPAVKHALTDTPKKAKLWTEADPKRGFRASQYLTAFDFRLRRNARDAAELRAERAAVTQTATKFDEILPEAADDKAAREARDRLLKMVEVNHQIVLSTQINPHNKLIKLPEDEERDPYNPMKPRKLPKGSTGRVIVGCMKNEAPYIVEWVAYHRAIGVDNFLIYTNDCTDGTSEILDRLQEMGVVEHRNNDTWRGNSPQQHALNQAQQEPVIRNADWIIHIDVDEFINVRTGNGTLDDFFDKVPDATNVAMTWRLFGHNGVTALADEFVIDQFDHCAPAYCPKPHTVWGFKTMFKNMGAYRKFSCHRPNGLQDGFEDKVRWVNGSGTDITPATAKNGWRSSKKTIGYDLIQLNHYALRSAESFLIKRQRGRALHVDRSIGINYWIRMDWSDFRDLTIKRNVPRLRAEYDRLMQDDRLRDLHAQGLKWHRAKADELHDMPEFQELYAQALKVKLTESERVAYALALDMDS